MKEVKGKRSGSFYQFIFNRIQEGKNPFLISKEYKISKQRIHYYTKILLDKGIIGKKKNGSWFTKVKTFSLGTRPSTNLHALQIHIPISTGNIGVQGWEVKEELKNWTPTYKKIGVLGGLTIKNNNNKSISIFAHTRDLKDLKEVDILSYEIRNWAYGWFRREFGVELDILNTEVKSLHLATADKNSEEMLSKGERFELDLDKKAEKVFPKDKMDGKAWVDGSPFSFTAETNDKEWKRAYLQMPFNMRDLLNSVHYIAQNYASHVKIVEQTSNILEKLDKRLEIKKRRVNFIDDKQRKLE